MYLPWCVIWGERLVACTPTIFIFLIFTNSLTTRPHCKCLHNMLELLTLVDWSTKQNPLLWSVKFLVLSDFPPYVCFLIGSTEDLIQRSVWEVPQFGGAKTSGPRPGDGVRFEEVWFRYPGAQEDTIKGVTFHIPPGTRLLASAQTFSFL